MRQIKTRIKIAEFFFGAFVSLLLVFPARASDITEQNVLRLSNEARRRVDLPDLQIDEQLTRVANLKVQDMLDNEYFAHTSPSGITPWHWFSKVKYDYEYAGENLAIDFASAEDQNDAWLKSETHRKNILNSKYTETGIAVAVGEIGNHSSLITVQVFASPRGVWDAKKSEFSFSPDRIIDLEEQRSGAVLSGQEVGNVRESGEYRGKEILIGNKRVDSLLWTLVLVLASAMLIINPIRLIGRSYGEIYGIIQEKIRRRLAWERNLARYEERASRMKTTQSEEEDLDNLNSVRLRV